MWVYALLLTVPVAAFLARMPHRAPPRRRRTIVDADDAESVEALVRVLERGDGGDALAERLSRVLHTFPPDERVMRRLSLLQQAHEGEGSSREFCVTTMYAIATDVLNEAAQ